MAVKILTLTVTWKTKPDANPYKQIPDSMQEKRFKAKKKEKNISHRFPCGFTAEAIF